MKSKVKIIRQERRDRARDGQKGKKYLVENHIENILINDLIFEWTLLFVHWIVFVQYQYARILSGVCLFRTQCVHVSIEVSMCAFVARKRGALFVSLGIIFIVIALLWSLSLRTQATDETIFCSWMSLALIRCDLQFTVFSQLSFHFSSLSILYFYRSFISLITHSENQIDDWR